MALRQAALTSTFLWWTVLSLTVVGIASGAPPDDRPTDPEAAAYLEKAFEKRFDFDVVQLVEIETTQRSSTVSRVLEMAMKRIDGRVHGVGYIVSPKRLRDTRLLMIENRKRSDDHFIFMPSEDKVRRVTSSRRADSFLGTGLSYEDLERRYIDEYDVYDEGTDEIDGEPVRVIAARPRYESGHDWAVYYVATADQAIREVRYWRGDKKRLLRVQRVPRDALMVRDGHLVPTRIELEDRARRSNTRVTFSSIRLDPDLDDKLFSRSAIELGRPIPHLGAASQPAKPPS